MGYQVQFQVGVQKARLVYVMRRVSLLVHPSPLLLLVRIFIFVQRNPFLMIRLAACDSLAIVFC